MRIDQINQAAWPAEGLQCVGACPVCDADRRVLELTGLSDTAFGAAPGTWNLWRCEGCGCGYLDPRPDPASIGLAYQNYFTHGSGRAGSRLDIWRKWGLRNSFYGRLFGRSLTPAVPGGWLLLKLQRRKAALWRQYCRGIDTLPGTGRRLLDVGCGNGDFLAFAHSVGWAGYGVEFDPAAAAVATGQGAQVLGARIEDLRGRYDGSFDAITLSHLIEHVHEPVEVLRHCRALLKPGGHLWLETPNIDGFGYGVFGRCWRGLETPRHLVLFSWDGMRQALTRAGFLDIRQLCAREVPFVLKKSLITRGGDLSDVGGARLDFAGRLQLQRLVRQARAAVRRDPRQSEFLTVTAVRG